MPYLQTQIPQDIENVFHHLFPVGGLGLGQQEQQVDVGKGCQFSPAIATHGHHG